MEEEEITAPVFKIGDRVKIKEGGIRDNEIRSHIGHITTISKVRKFSDHMETRNNISTWFYYETIIDDSSFFSTPIYTWWPHELELLDSVEVSLCQEIGNYLEIF